MSRFYSYLNSAEQILLSYNGAEPLAAYLKKFFSQHKKFGSRDRKNVGHLCYCYFRTGHSLQHLTLTERIKAGLFLCSESSNEMLEAFDHIWNEKAALSTDAKFGLLGGNVAEVFPWKDELSEGIAHLSLCHSLLVQPDLFLRVRPGHSETVIKKLEHAGISFDIRSETCLALPNASRIDQHIQPDTEAVVQDYNSQQTSQLVLPVIQNRKDVQVWDCCAASGGKSIMVYDINPGIELSVSDIRESIISNLRKRFERAGINGYRSFVADITRVIPARHQFDLVIADVPCSGSGTWGRTPEQLFYFDKNKINDYAALQRKIVSNAITAIKPGGFLFYITCSVFRKENEEQVAFFNKQLKMDIKDERVLPGYRHRSDSMFAALLQKPL